MKPKNQRLVLVVAALAALLAAVLLAMWGLRDRASYFYTPADMAAGKAHDGEAIRLGGMVERGSIQHLPGGVTIRFVLTDGRAETPVTFRGIAPDLFREGSGAVAEGRMEAAPSSPTPSSPSMTSATCRPNSATSRRAQSREDAREMIAETGLAALWLAAGLAALQFVLMILALRSEADVRGAMRSIAVVQGVLTLLAFVMLLIVFARSDMSVALVFENSNSAKPFIYKVAGAWGNHEGSMLMWVTILAIAGAFLALLSRRTSERTLVAALGAQAVLALGFYAFLLFASNPFARLWPAPPDGQGLNPLLQDPGLAFHPPTLYLGYVGLSVAFSLAVGALLTGEVDSRLARAMRPWVLGAWILLTLGITAGSYWAYYELGWGGYWFWDPVENASLMPWLAATALLHSINVLAARGALKAGR